MNIGCQELTQGNQRRLKRIQEDSRGSERIDQGIGRRDDNNERRRDKRNRTGSRVDSRGKVRGIKRREDSRGLIRKVLGERNDNEKRRDKRIKEWI